MLNCIFSQSQGKSKFVRANKGEAQGLAWSFPDKQSLKPQLYPYKFPRLQSNEVRIKILYFGVGKKDLKILNSTKNDVFVPGQQVVGIVQAIGQKVGQRKIGQIVGVGLLKNNCKNCKNCWNGSQQYCKNSKNPLTYFPDFGGFNTHVHVNADWAFPIPKNIPLEKAAPLFSAGITAFNIIYSEYERLRHNFNRKLRVAIVGLGAVGHMAVKFAQIFNYQISIFSHTPQKQQLLKNNGIKYDHFILESAQNFNKNGLKYDLVIVSGDLPEQLIQLSFNLSRRTGKTVLVNPFSGQIDTIGVLLVVDQKQISGVRTGNRDQYFKMLQLVAKNTKTLLPICQNYNFNEFQKVLEQVKTGVVNFRAIIKVQENTVDKFNNGN